MPSENINHTCPKSAHTPLLLAAVFVTSFSALSFEVLLARVFSINQWNHLSFMVISIALLGFAISGTGLNVLDSRRQGWEKTLSSPGALSLLLTAFTVSTLAAFGALNRMPLDYFRLPVQPVQAIYLLAAYLLLSLPFFFTGTVVSTAYAARPEKTGTLYLATMGGSGCGALAPALLLGFMGEADLILAAALLPQVLVLSAAVGLPDAGRRPGSIWAGAALLLAAATILVRFSGLAWFEVRPSDYKSLKQTLRLPDTEHLVTRTGLPGRIDLVQSPHLRFAPGLSLTYRGEIPGHRALFRDGDQRLVLYQSNAGQPVDFARFTLPFAGYLVAKRPSRVLLASRNGGLAFACARTSGADRIDWIEPDPKAARILAAHYNRRLIRQRLRQQVLRSTARYDVIHVEDWGTSIPGSSALDQNHWFTVDAFSQYLDRLAPNGVLVMSRRLLLPPSDSLRMWASAYEALQQRDVAFPETHIAVLRAWDTYILLVGLRPIADSPDLLAFVRQRNFDVVYRDGMEPREANRFFVFDRPYHYLEIQRLSAAYRSGDPAGFYRGYLLDVAPQSDDRPFPDRMMKWPRIGDLYNTLGSRPYAMFLSGELVVAVVFFEALLISIALLVIPVLLVRRKGRHPGVVRVVYFLSVGAGFIAVELYFIKQYILLFENAVVSFTLVLTVMLLFSGLGGFFSNRLKPGHLVPAVALLTMGLLCQWLATPHLLEWLLHRSFAIQLLAAGAWLVPAALLAGGPFPLGMRYLVRTPAERTYAWSANGCTSVLASTAAAQTALSLGISAIMAGAVAAYAITLICAMGVRSSN
jgi:hypothetical protein